MNPVILGEHAEKHTPIILDGKAYADSICKRLHDEVAKIMRPGSVKEPPTLMIVSTGNDKASMTYLNNKARRCMEIGINIVHKHFNVLRETDIDSLCCKNFPVIFQTPITTTGAYNVGARLQRALYDPASDVDGFICMKNLAGLYSTGCTVPTNLPCTAKGIMSLLSHHDISIEGKTVCVFGRSDVVGRPTARMFESKDATVIQCHSKTPRDVQMKMFELSDIIVSAVGVPNFITEYDLISKNERGKRMDISKKVIVDVGINRVDGKICGDIPESLKQKAYAYTPVPGGVGPMTVAMLMYNTIRTWKICNGLGVTSWL